jgi:hypothetical protein
MVRDRGEDLGDDDPGRTVVDRLYECRIGSRVVIEERDVGANAVVPGLAEVLLEQAAHAAVHPTVVAPACLQVRLAQPVEEDRAHGEGYEPYAVLVELPELVDPADGVVGLRLPVGEVDDGGVPAPFG